MLIGINYVGHQWAPPTIKYLAANNAKDANVVYIIKCLFAFFALFAASRTSLTMM